MFLFKLLPGTTFFRNRNFGHFIDVRMKPLGIKGNGRLASERVTHAHIQINRRAA
jgi:hypothetical protein